MTNPMQPLDPAGAPDPVTPHASPSDPAGFASVTPHGPGPAPYDIQAPMPDTEGPFAQSVAVAGAGVLYAQGPRQVQAAALLDSPQGYGGVTGYDIDAGFSGGGGDSGWPNNVDPGGNIGTPVTGSPTGTYQGTGTD
jgi:hypothetical protein